MGKHFIIDKELIRGTVRTDTDFQISFNKEEKEILLSETTTSKYVPFTQIRDYVDTLNALVFALRDDIDAAIEEDNEYLPWEPFEHWDYVALADAIRSFHYQFERLIKEERGE